MPWPSRARFAAALAHGAATIGPMLILVPTSLELRGVFPEIAAQAQAGAAPWLPQTSLGEPAWVARCGFGLAASGARAAALWSRVPGDACLTGLAGTYDAERVPQGSVVLADAVEVEGIGFGAEASFTHPAASGGALESEWETQRSMAPWTPPMPARRVAMLSVASASGDAAHAAQRRTRHPACDVEEMEGEAVLQAARALGRRLAILRCVSNVAGDRDQARWRMADALSALRAALDSWLRP